MPAARPLSLSEPHIEPENIMKKFIALLAVAAALTLSGCSGTDTASPSAAQSESAAPTPQVPDLAGLWKQDNPASAESYQQATIIADTISIEWVMDGGDTTSIYWVGSFDAPVDATDPYTWTSRRDVAATASALLASSDDTKAFTCEGDTISYKVSALGTTTTVHLKKK
jgi:ABC-type oligopeptide transport system substrate-binding subunit